MHWHIDCDIISLFATCLLIIYQRRMHPDAKEKLRTKRFTLCLSTCAIVTVIDILASVIMDKPISRFLYHLLMTPYFISIVLVILSWFFFSLSILYDDNAHAAHTVGIITIIPYIIYAALALSNPWTGLYFTLDENMAYTRGPLFFLMVAVFGAYTVVLFALTIVRRKHIDKRYSGAVLLMIPIMLGVSIVVQLMNNGWLTILPTYFLCLLLAFFFLQSDEIERQSILLEHLSIEAATDKLTGVLNRAGAEARMKKALADDMYAQCLILFVDVDDLKQINDVMGHEYGDKALVAVSMRLREFFRTTDIIARYGGDEFIVCLFGSFEDKQINRWLERLHRQLNGVPIEGDISVNASIGAAYGDILDDCFEELLHQADEALYGVKRSGKNSFALYSPPGGQG